MKIRIGIAGYGNLGRGVEYAIAQNDDMELCGIFTRRNPSSIKSGMQKPDGRAVELFPMADAPRFAGEIDVMIMCGGSARDLPVQTPEFAKCFNVVDSFDTHAKVEEHFMNVDAAAKSSRKTALISAGWDPGLFSLHRLISQAVLPNGKSYTFWGRGISQGHSDAVRRIDGVIDARQYTIPSASALDAARGGENPELSTREKHTRECFVVARDGEDLDRIEREIVTMPNYFADYDTTVHFISAEELARNHSAMPHGGFAIRSGNTGCGSNNGHIVELGIKLDSNPEFTSSILTACARAVFRLNREGSTGCRTIFDIPPSYYSAESDEDLRKKYL